MDINTLRRRLEVWKRVLFINIGASIALFVQAILIYQESGSLIFPTSWYGVWFVVQLAVFLPGFVLLWGKHWMRIPLLERLNTIFGYFAVAWLTMLPVALSAFNFFWLGCGMAVATSYWWLRRKSLEIQNEMFP